MSRILIRGARQLLTLHGPPGPRRGSGLGDIGVIQDGAVLIENGVIREVGPSRRIENIKGARNAQEIDATGRVVMPGFVDSHTHLVCGPPRIHEYEMRIAGTSYQEIVESGGGILWSVRAVRATPIRRLMLSARRALESWARLGTTTIEAKTGYGLDESSELKILRLMHALPEEPVSVVSTYLAHTMAPGFDGGTDHYIEWQYERMLPLVRRRKLARFADVYCEPGAFSVDQSRRYLEAARSLGFELKLQAEQFSHSGGAALGVELRVRSVDHLEQASRSDVATLAGSESVATLLPGSVFYLGLDRYAPARSLIDEGAAVALATGYNPGTSPTPSMPMIISLACLHMKMSPAEAISAATINGACALGCSKKCGSLEAGKDADLVILDCSDYRELPYRFGASPVALTIKRGKVVYSQGHVEWPAK